MSANVCPACGAHMISDRRNDAFGIRRVWNQCRNLECLETGWDMAVSREDFNRAERRRFERAQAAAQARRAVNE